MAERLEGTKIAFFAAPQGTEQVELVVPWERLTDAGAELELVSLEPGQIQMVNHRERGGTFAVDRVVGEVTPDAYDGLVLPGGVANPDAARMNPEAVAFVRGFFD